MVCGFRRVKISNKSVGAKVCMGRAASNGNAALARRVSTISDGRRLDLFSFCLYTCGERIDSCSAVIIVIGPFAPLGIMPRITGYAAAAHTIIMGAQGLCLRQIDGIRIFASCCHACNLTGDLIVRIAHGNGIFCGLPYARCIGVVVIPIKSRHGGIQRVISDFTFGSLRHRSASKGHGVRKLSNSASSHSKRELSVMLRLTPS